MANSADVTISVNEEIVRIALESKAIIEGFHRLLKVHSSSEALAKIAVLMREDDTADRLLSKALGHLHSCPETGSNKLYQEIAEAFGAASVPPVEGWKPSGFIRLGSGGSMIDRICEAIATSTIFSPADVREAWDMCHSWDLVVSMCELARATGVSLARATSVSISSHLNESMIK